MNVSQKEMNFRHGRAIVKATTCLLLLTAGGVISPVQAAQESMGITSTTSVQQNGTVIKGVVVDVNGEPIIGASVVEKGNPKNGTITDFDGNYTLKVKSNKTPLVVSYIGFISQETKGGKLTLQEDLKSLNEVVSSDMVHSAKAISHRLYRASRPRTSQAVRLVMQPSS